MTKTQAWLLATRPRTLTATLVPILVGSALSFHHQGYLSKALVAYAFLCTLCLQIATNLVNDVSDFKKGTDNDQRLGPARATAQGWLSSTSVWAGACLALLGALLTGTPLMLAGGWPIIILGLASLLAAVAYTAGPFPLAYNGLGEVFVLVFFGWVAVGGLVFVLTGAWDVPGLWLAGTQVGLLAVSMIAINNLRDIHGDRQNGKKTLAARFGEIFIRRCITLAVFSPYVLGLAWAYRYQSSMATILPFLALPLAIKPWRQIRSTPPSRAMNALLGKISLHLLAFGLLLALGLAWK